ncbi:hypothetical protein C8N25_106200 [Algoriphagus antarcticus]|uniref:Uncharacterized protein n=1 Tax=Algoriphagus antarcticus TaxID=238540 RepID=A0A3E0E058_9BACT|nr:hypothetical protein C8N25_106200 [Algoriphagus antarcticus]
MRIGYQLNEKDDFLSISVRHRRFLCSNRGISVQIENQKNTFQNHKYADYSVDRVKRWIFIIEVGWQ